MDINELAMPDMLDKLFDFTDSNLTWTEMSSFDGIVTDISKTWYFTESSGLNYNCTWSETFKNMFNGIEGDIENDKFIIFKNIYEEYLNIFKGKNKEKAMRVFRDYFHKLLKEDEKNGILQGGEINRILRNINDALGEEYNEMEFLSLRKGDIIRFLKGNSGATALQEGFREAVADLAMIDIAELEPINYFSLFIAELNRNELWIENNTMQVSTKDMVRIGLIYQYFLRKRNKEIGDILDYRENETIRFDLTSYIKENIFKNTKNQYLLSNYSKENCFEAEIKYLVNCIDNYYLYFSGFSSVLIYLLETASPVNRGWNNRLKEYFSFAHKDKDIDEFLIEKIESLSLKRQLSFELLGKYKRSYEKKHSKQGISNVKTRYLKEKGQIDFKLREIKPVENKHKTPCLVLK